MTIARTAGSLAALGCAAAAHVLAPPSWSDVRELGAWLVRPLALPLAWSGMKEAQQHGDAAEAFARSQQLLHLVPGWTDGHAVFAFRHALGSAAEHSASGATPAERAPAALRRLQTALAWLESARTNAGRHEVDLLLSMASLAEIAGSREPGIDPLLRADGGTIGIADRCLAAAERLRPSAAVREQRTFLSPRLAGSLLASGDRDRALAVLDNAVARSEEVRDRELAAEWRSRLDEVRRCLRGERVDLRSVRADPRMAPLLPWLP